jgi:hypothetical protein
MQVGYLSLSSIRNVLVLISSWTSIVALMLFSLPY